MWPRSVFALFSLAAGSTALPGQESDSLPRVLVTATRVDAAFGTGLTAASVVDRSFIERTGVRDVAELLRLLPGVSVARSGGPGAQSSLFLRGGEADYVRVLVDGVLVNDPGGAIDLSWLTVDDIERVEMVRGPASVLYGTDAVSGVIQLFTRRPARSVTDASAAAGRYGTVHLQAGAGIATDLASLSVSGARDRSDGILPFNSEYRRDVFSASIRARPDRGPRAELALRAVDDEYHFPTDGAGAVVDRNAYRRNRRLITTAAVTHEFTDRVRGELQVSGADLRGRDDDRADSPSDTVGFHHYEATGVVRRRVADVRLHLTAARSAVVTLGAEWMREAQRGADSSNFSLERSRFAADRRNLALYGQWLSEHGALSLTAGARVDDNDTYGDFTTGRVGAAYRPWRGGTLRATLGTAFKGPTFFESFTTAFSTGNPDLVPERSRSWDAGLRQVTADGRLTFAITWFDQRFRDMIQYGFVAPDQPNFFNVAEASVRGLEFEATTRLTSRIRAGVATTLLRSRVENAGLQEGEGEAATFVKGERLLRRPAVVATATVGVDLPSGVTVDVAVQHTGPRNDRDFSTFPATPVVLPSWTRTDLAITAPAFGVGDAVSLDVFARLENVLGSRHEEIVNYPAPGRSLTIGVRAASLRR